MDVIAPAGVVGPTEAAALKRHLLELCSQERPLVHVDLRGVEELHLTAANSIIRAAMEAHRHRGTLTVTTTAGSSVRVTIARAGLYQQLDP
ncbi:MAG: STAS domain-containing protein [Acidimicrobiia bacterium]|nr:STAS domain-containing protein [Acidimicrobiia bacterium]